MCQTKFNIENYGLRKGAKVYPASGRRSSKRVPVEDLGNNRRPSSCMSLKGDLVRSGGWYVKYDSQAKHESLDCGLLQSTVML